MAAGLEPLVVFWSGWGIHITVLFSFAVQITLLLLADIRRHADWAVLKVIIWSAYMLADTTAIYALGHLSVVVRSPEHHLMALWAPLLLVHLGGQDNITAYAIEDNRLWLRHLQTFGVQLVAAGYVMYASSILSHPSLLRLTAILMYVVGVLKYGERVFALMGADSCASSSLSATSYKDFRAEQAGDRLSVIVTSSQDGELELGVLPAEPASMRDEVAQGVMSAGQPIQPRQGDKFEGLAIAYSLLDVPKQMFEGPTRFVKIKKARRYEGKFMLEVVQMQLMMMYDLLYTKAAVVHTWYGFLVRVISLPFTVAATLLLFHALSDKEDGYGRADILVTKVLLTGGVVLETMSMLRAMFSMWTAALLYRRKWYTLGRVVQLVEWVFGTKPMMLLVGWQGYWSGNLRQHDLFKVLYHTDFSRGSIIAKKMGREDLWDSTFYSWSTPIHRLIINKVLELVSRKTEDGQIDITESRGRNAIRIYLSLGEDLAWTVALDLDESILVWHIATYLYLLWFRENFDPIDELWDRCKATGAVCNYMFFLLAARPYMLPYPVTRQRYVQLCHDSITHLSRFNVSDLLGAVFAHREAFMKGSPLQADGAGNIIGVPPNRRTAQPSVNSTVGGGAARPSINTTLDKGCQLAAKLIHHTAYETEMINALHTLNMIFDVWAEMLCYTAYWCNEKSHAKNLANGGEFMTIVALMMVYKSNGFI